ncbi:hypothetical protein GCM10010124_40270 [Pilimelia terevasa]|uniref:Tyr recombinase domain-containing protein n=1 Tax=Pilimelia terevasa TaxID=53372 RepID=A0A8J3BV58_9ACTN|nr:hypothetical protein GCM10010124_40270 [Pilimelia terevasa]
MASGLFFVRPDGTAWHPEQLSRMFYKLVRDAGLPPVRLHDLRHLAATMMLAAGATLKEIQDTSATPTTASPPTYTPPSSKN